MDNNTKIALTIFKKCLQNERINSNLNEDIYEAYRYDTNISNDVEEMLEIFNMEIFESQNDGLFITPGVNNNLFGFSNEDLRKALSIKNNTELSVCFFMMYCILTRFYKESSFIPSAEFITQIQLIDDAESKVRIIKNMLSQRDKEDSSIEKDTEETSFLRLVKFWDEISYSNIKSKAKDVNKDEKSDAKIAYANRVLKFFCANDLLMYNEIQNFYVARPKLATIVGYYYDEFRNRSEIVEYLESLDLESPTIESTDLENSDTEDLSSED